MFAHVHGTLALYPGFPHPRRAWDEANGTHGKLIVVTAPFLLRGPTNIFFFKKVHSANVTYRVV